MCSSANQIPGVLDNPYIEQRIQTTEAFMKGRTAFLRIHRVLKHVVAQAQLA